MTANIKALPPGSYAWCSDCAWRDESPACEVNGRLHSTSLLHIVHVWEKDVCADPMIEAFGQTHNCERAPGHAGAHLCSAHDAPIEW